MVKLAASHPDVRKFKNFVKNNPHVLRDVKEGDKTLQDLFEEYMLFGEEDDIWDTYREKGKEDERAVDSEDKSDRDTGEGAEEQESESSTTQDLLAMLKKVNFNDLQNSLSQFSGVLASVQELLGQFRSTPGQGGNQQNHPQQNSPFSYHDD